MSLLKVTAVSKTFAVEGGMFRAAGAVRAVDSASLELAPGRAVGIVGESGSGKTTLGKMICRLLKRDAGEITIDGKNIDDYSRLELSHKVQMVFQDPFASLNPKLTIGTTLMEAAGHLNSAERRQKIESILQLVGLPAAVTSAYPHQFSGGQRQRIALARALIRQPKLIVADEPLSALDISIQNQLLNLFAQLKEELSISFLFISHDVIAASMLADRLLVMKEGKIVEEGITDKVIAAPQHPYTQRLLSAVPHIS